VSICPFAYLLWPLYCLLFFVILKLFIGFHVPFYNKPEKESSSKISSLVTFDTEDLRTLVMIGKCYISLYSIIIPGGNQLQYVRVFQHT
jgi:hypothetical protein